MSKKSKVVREPTFLETAKYQLFSPRYRGRNMLYAVGVVSGAMIGPLAALGSYAGMEICSSSTFFAGYISGTMLTMGTLVHGWQQRDKGTENYYAKRFKLSGQSIDDF